MEHYLTQDMQKEFPEVVSIVDEENGYLGVDYIQLVPVLIEAVKELQAENEALKELVCLDYPNAKTCQ